MYNRIEEHFRKNHDKLVNKFYRYTRNRARAEDVVSEGYYRALLYNHTCDPDNFDKWFNRILNNAMKDNTKIEAQGGAVAISEDIDVPVKPAALPRIVLEEVKQYIKTKPEQDAKLYNMFLIDQLSNNEIAMATGDSIGNIRIKIHRFRQDIRDKFKWSF